MTVLYRAADGLAVGLFMVIGYLSLTPLPVLPDVPGNDKLHHFIAYAALAFFALLQRKTRNTVLIALLAVIAYGGAIEALQPYVNRYGEVLDFLANGAGACLGWLLVQGARRSRRTAGGSGRSWRR